MQVQIVCMSQLLFAGTAVGKLSGIDNESGSLARSPGAKPMAS